jgi:hypothetical protein
MVTTRLASRSNTASTICCRMPPRSSRRSAATASSAPRIPNCTASPRNKTRGPSGSVRSPSDARDTTDAWRQEIRSRREHRPLVYDHCPVSTVGCELVTYGNVTYVWIVQLYEVRIYRESPDTSRTHGVHSRVQRDRGGPGGDLFGGLSYFGGFAAGGVPDSRWAACPDVDACFMPLECKGDGTVIPRGYCRRRPRGERSLRASGPASPPRRPGRRWRRRRGGTVPLGHCSECSFPASSVSVVRGVHQTFAGTPST